MSIPFVQTNSGINVYVGNKMEAVGTDHPNFVAIQDLCRDIDATIEDVKELIDVAASVQKFSDGKITIEGDIFKFEGNELHNGLTSRIMGMLKEGEDVSIFINFMDSLMENPSHRAVNELYGFLEACKLPITSDGCFLAYKKVRHDYMDLHSNTMDNSIGKTVKMTRNLVDEDSSRTCSAGLHAASFGYMSSYGTTGVNSDNRVIIVKINPKDVVAVPQDYNNQKMRVCEYTVIDEIPNDGFTQIVDWVYGDRDVAFLRDTITSLKNMAKDAFGLESAPEYDQQLFSHKVSEVKKEEFLASVVKALDLKTEPDTFITRYGDKITVKNLLQWVSNYTA